MLVHTPVMAAEEQFKSCTWKYGSDISPAAAAVATILRSENRTRKYRRGFHQACLRTEVFFT
jgi:hypothetical protein